MLIVTVQVLGAQKFMVLWNNTGYTKVAKMIQSHHVKVDTYTIIKVGIEGIQRSKTIIRQ